MSPPLISEYKRSFIVRRLLQTFLGGPKIKLGFKAPLFIYVIHIALFLMPWILAELITPFINNEELNMTTTMYIYGSIIGALVLAIQLLNYFAQKETSVVSKINKASHLLEDDEVEFSACCGIETYQFIFSRKNNWFHIVCYSIISAIMCATSLNYLHIHTLKEWWECKSTAVILHLFGWLTICISQYSLTVVNPPEPAVYSNEKHQFIRSTFRPFYIYCLLTVHFISWKYENWKEIDEYLHIIFILLPLLWILGILPPQDALLLWVEEQLLCLGLGGSAIPSDWWLMLILGVSISLMMIVYSLQNWIIITIVCSCLGYLLSLDLESIFTELLRKFYSNSSKKNANDQNYFSSYNFKQFFFHLVMITVAGLEMWISSQQDLNQYQSDIWKICGTGSMALVITAWLLGQLQKIYLFGGLIKNKLYPSNIQNIDLFKSQKKKLISLHYLRIAMKIMIPFVMIFILSVFGQLDRPKEKCLLTSLSTVRAFRLAWQHSENLCLDISLIYIINECSSLLTDLSLPFLVDLLIIGFVRDRLIGMWKKLYVVAVIIFTSMANRKQRIKYGWLFLGLDVVFLPIVLVFIILAIGLTSPLVPLFTLPIFITGFPRPTKFWSGKIGLTSSDSIENIYYQQMVSSLKKELRILFSKGSLGFINSGDFYLARFQDRLLWIQILERGFNYCKANIKGLELQETSCHTLEASRVDEIFEQAFKEKNNENRETCQNPNFFNTLIPCDVAITKIYSDAHNVLTGIIHSKDTLNLIKKEFPKVMTWLLIKYIISNKFKSQYKSHKSDLDISKKVEHPLTDSNAKLSRPLSRQSIKHYSEFQNQPSEGRRNNEKWAKVRSFSSLSSWPEDDDPLENSTISHSEIKGIKSKNSNQDETAKQHITLPGYLQDNVHSTKDTNFDERRKWNDIIFYSPSPLLPPKDWMVYPANIYLHNEKEIHFSYDWFHKTIKMLAGNIKDLQINELLDDVNIPKIYEKLISYCYHALFFDVLNIHGPNEVCKLFLGTLPLSPLQEWLDNCQELRKIVLTSYRYSVKLSLDQTLIGPINDDDEFYECLQDYDNHWHIGVDGDQEWKDAVLKNCPYLFSIGYNIVEDTYVSHLLSLEDQPVFIGSLNSALVQSIWSSLCIELLYLTNDDEERYSIQAEPTILRNLTVQAANQPLGYPVYSSEQISFSTLL